MSLLVEGLCAAYGDTQILWDIDLECKPGEVVALIGSNGAGKSTLLGAVTGIVKCTGGRVRAGNTEITHLPPDRVVQSGVVQVPQGRRLFGSLTVRENLLMGAYLRRDDKVVADLERCLVMLPRLRERLTYLAGRLSGGEQQMVAIARAMMARPTFLLIDEMSLGLAPVLVDQLLEILKQINAQGVGIIIVEQDVQTALEASTRAYVLETGHVRMRGKSADMLDDPAIKRAYLGV